MNLRAKIVLLVLLAILATVFLSTLGVGFLVQKQNDDNGRNLVNRAATVVHTSLPPLERRRLDRLSRFTADPSILVGMRYLWSIKDQPNVGAYKFILERPKEQMAELLFELAQGGFFQGFYVYDRQGDLVAYLQARDEATEMGVTTFDLAGNPALKRLLVPAGSAPTQDWAEAGPVDGRWAQSPYPRPDQAQTWYDALEGQVALCGLVPLGQAAKGEDGEEAAGWVLFHTIFDKPLLERLQLETQTEVNLFAGDRPSLGTLAGLKALPGDALSPDALNPAAPSFPVRVVAVQDRDYYQAVIPLRGRELPSSFLVLSLSREDTLRKTRENILLLLAIMALVLALSTPTVFWVAGKMSGRINDILGAVNQITGGNLRARVPVTSGDELGQLADAFNRMTKDLAQSMDRLAQSAEQYRNLFDFAPDGIVISLPSGQIIATNQAFKQIFKIPPGDDPTRFTAQRFYQNPGQDRQRLLSELERRGKAEHIESVLLDAQGNPFPASQSSRLVQFEGRQAILTIIRDITWLKQAQAELQSTRNYLRNVIDSMPSVVVGVDPGGHVTQWNLQAVKDTGLTPEDALGRPLSLVYPALASQMENVVKSLRERRETKSEKVPHQVNGDTLYYDVMVYPLTANGVEGAVIRVDDVTARVRIEEMMVQTEKMMSVGGLAAGMAHEINNPLGGIMLATDMALRRISPDVPANRRIALECGVQWDGLRAYLEASKMPYYLEGIREATIRASRIVSNMLSFSRGRAEARLKVDLAALLEKVVDLASSDYDLKKLYDFRHIEIVRQYDPELPPVTCEPTEVEQVFLNLLKNAAQAMHEKQYQQGGPRITLRTRREGGMAVVEVEDNGPGMDESVRRRVFEPFFTTKQVGMGTGLGLSVSYFIITANHKGTLNLESTPGKGSRFIIGLPLDADRPEQGTP